MDDYKKHNGLIGLIVVLVILVGLGVGGFYLIKNREKLDISMPWEDNTNRSSNKKNNKEDKIDEELKLGELDVDGQQPCSELSDLLFSAHNLKKDDKGYTFDLFANNKEGDYSVSVDMYKTLVDNYEVSTTEKFTINAGEEKTFNMRILKTDLDSQDMERFKTITIYMNAEDDNPDEAKTEECVLNMTIAHNILVDNEKKNLQLVDEKDETKISYYDLKEDKDYNYIYFLVNNRRVISASSVYIKKLVINDKIYSLPDFKEDVFKGARKAFYLRIPKKDFKKIEKFTVSFFIESKAGGKIKDPERTGARYYVTNEFTKTFANDK